MLAERAAQEIVPAVDAHPHGVVVLELRDTPFSFESLSPSDQTRIKRDHGARAATIYEWAVGALIHTIINTVASERPEAVLSVLGLPVEPEEMGLDAEMARRTNERYRNVINRLGPFVPTRSFVVFGTSLDQTNLATMGMREAVRLRDGRPIVFQMNFKWRVFADTDDAGYLLADSSAESAQMSEVRGQDQPELYLEASLLDD